MKSARVGVFLNRAIITGANGLVGMSVARYLLSLGIELVCLGRENLSAHESRQCFGAESKYICLPMHSIALLPEKLEELGWSAGEATVFYNFAWSGRRGLADGEFSDQLNNAVWAAEAVKVAKILACTKFINSGSMEETFIEDYSKVRNTQVYKSAQTNYGLTKLAARDMCKTVAYIEAIDYVHTRMSVPLASDLSKGTYISATMKKILKGEVYELPRSESLYDVVLLEDVAIAYHLIGLTGHNKANYFIGTGKPATLRHHFERFVRLVRGQSVVEIDMVENDHGHLFDVKTLRQDTGFVSTHGLQHIISKAVSL